MKTPADYWKGATHMMFMLLSLQNWGFRVDAILADMDAQQVAALYKRRKHDMENPDE